MGLRNRCIIGGLVHCGYDTSDGGLSRVSEWVDRQAHGILMVFSWF